MLVLAAIVITASAEVGIAFADDASVLPAGAGTVFPQKGTRGMWVWTTPTILTDSSEGKKFVNEVWRSGATQVFLYLTGRQIAQYKTALRSLIGQLNAEKIIAYSMDGERGYFSDADGPADLYAGVTAMINYNASVNANERFVGFMADMEPQDGQGVGKSLFHNGIKQSALTPSQLLDRNNSMTEWLTIHQTLHSMVQKARLRLASSLPSWTDNYYGEPVLATFKGTRADVTQFLMTMVDDYCVMSYNTDPSNIASRIASKLSYADTLSRPPRVFGSVETHVGAGENISYGDTPPKSTKAAVVTDLNTVFGIIGSHPTFSGMNIHDWVGWRDLPVVSNDTANPRPPTHAGTAAVSGWWP